MKVYNKLSKLINMVKKVPYIFIFFNNPLDIMFNYLLNKTITIKMKNGKIIKIKKGKGSVGSIIWALKNNIKVEDHELGVMFTLKDGTKLVQPNLGVINENLKREYGIFNYIGAVVLDVGAYFGESGVLFNKLGAKRIIAVEPLSNNVKYIKINFELNKVKDYLILNYAVSKKCGYETWKVNPRSIGSPGFGLHAGNKSIRVKTISWEKLLDIANKNKVNIIKVDCEGCEKYLLLMNPKIIKKFKKWIIETHSKDIENKITKFFNQMGYKTKLITENSKNIKVFGFNLI